MADAITPMISKTFIDGTIECIEITRVYLNDSAGTRKQFLDLSSISTFPALLIFNDDPYMCIGITSSSSIWSNEPSQWPDSFLFHFNNALFLTSTGDMLNPYTKASYGKYKRYFGTSGDQYPSGTLDMSWDISYSFRATFAAM